MAMDKTMTRMLQTDYIEDAAERPILRADSICKYMGAARAEGIPGAAPAETIGCPNRRLSSVIVIAEQNAAETHSGGLEGLP